MRRREREKTREFALSIIDKSAHMVLAVTGEDGAPYCVPLSPVRWDDHIYFHCALEGRKLDAMRSEPRVCMTFVGDAQVPAGRFTTYYESAVAFGRAGEVTEEGEMVEALRRLCLKYCPEEMELFGREVRRSLPRTGIWKISLDEVTGKSNFPARRERAAQASVE